MFPRSDKVMLLMRCRQKLQRTVASLLLVVLLSPSISLGRVPMPEWSNGDSKKYDEPGTAPLGVGLWPAGNSVVSRDSAGSPQDLDGKMSTIAGDVGDDRAGDKVKKDALVFRVDEAAADAASKPLPTEPVGVIEFTPMRLVNSPLVISTGPNRQQIAPEETKRMYFNQRPLDFLVDPLALLTEQKSHDISRFLEYHSEGAPYDICLMVLRENERVPDDLSLAKLHEQWFGEERVALVVYPFGHPRDMRFEFGPAVSKIVSRSVVSRIEQSVLAEASVGVDPSDQVERLSIELSIRLYWLARILDRPQSMTEAEAELAADEHQSSARDGEAEATANLAMRWSWVVLTILLSFGLGIMVWCLSRRNSLRGGPVFFPDRELPVRLGGASSGGACAEISFRFGGDQERGR